MNLNKIFGISYNLITNVSNYAIDKNTIQHLDNKVS